MKTIVLVIIMLISFFVFCGCVEEKQIDKTEVEIINQKPVANFNFSNNLYTVSFVDTSIDPDSENISYFWDFGDGTTSSEQNPIYTYDCSETNLFDITLTVSDGESTDAYTDNILFASHLNIVGYSQIWIRNETEYYGDMFVWNGYLTMAIENTGNLPADISYASITQYGFTESDLSGNIYFNFTYTYDELIGGENGNGFKQETWLTFISNNTLTLSAGKSITLTSNPELTYFTYVGDESFTPGNYYMNIWLYERKKGEDKSHTLYETTVELN